MNRFPLILILCSLLFAPSLFAAHPVGTLHRDTILGVPCRVYLPSSYEEHVKNNLAVFPCLYLQHGMFGCEDDWANHDLIPIMDSLLKEEVIVEMVIIMPDNFLGSIPPAERKRLMDAPNLTPDGEPFVVKDGQCHWRKLTREQERAYEQSGYWEEHFADFIDAVEQKYYLSPRSKNRAVAGLSTTSDSSRRLSCPSIVTLTSTTSLLTASPNNSLTARPLTPTGWTRCADKPLSRLLSGSEWDARIFSTDNSATSAVGWMLTATNTPISNRQADTLGPTGKSTSSASSKSASSANINT